MSTAQRTLVKLDFPAENETVFSRNYTFRISAMQAQSVEVSVNHGSWLPCRPCAGYWWFDWSGYSSGDYELEARAKLPDSHGETSLLRRFRVFLG